MAELPRAARAAERLESEPAAEELPADEPALLQAPAGAEAVDPVAAAEAVAPSKPVAPGAQTAWVPAPAAAPVERPSGSHVALPSASPGDLWGKPMELPRVQAVLDGLLPQKPQGQRAEVERQIEQRAGELNQKWRGCDAAFRGREVLRLEKRLPAEARGALAADTDKLARVAALRQQLHRRRAEAEALCRGEHPQGHDVSFLQKQRAAWTAGHCGRSLERLGKVEEKVVEKAERQVDAQGLRLELLTQAESRLDPTAPREKRLGYLLSVWLGVFTGVMQEQRELEQQQAKDAEAARDSAEDDERVRQSLVRRLEQARHSLPTQTSEPLRIIRG